MIRAKLPNKLLSRKLAFAIDCIAPIRQVKLRVRSIRVSRKNIIRRNGNKPHPSSVARSGYISRATRIEPISQIYSLLASVNCCHRCTMDYSIRLLICNNAINALLIRYVSRRQVSRNNFTSTHKLTTNRSAEHPLSTCKKHLHLISPLRAPLDMLHNWTFHKLPQDVSTAHHQSNRETKQSPQCMISEAPDAQ